MRLRELLTLASTLGSASTTDPKHFIAFVLTATADSWATVIILNRYLSKDCEKGLFEAR